MDRNANFGGAATYPVIFSGSSMVSARRKLEPSKQMVHQLSHRPSTVLVGDGMSKPAKKRTKVEPYTSRRHLLEGISFSSSPIFSEPVKRRASEVQGNENVKQKGATSNEGDRKMSVRQHLGNTFGDPSEVLKVSFVKSSSDLVYDSSPVQQHPLLGTERRTVHYIPSFKVLENTAENSSRHSDICFNTREEISVSCWNCVPERTHGISTKEKSVFLRNSGKQLLDNSYCVVMVCDMPVQYSASFHLPKANGKDLRTHDEAGSTRISVKPKSKTIGAKPHDVLNVDSKCLVRSLHEFKLMKYHSRSTSAILKDVIAFRKKRLGELLKVKGKQKRLLFRLIKSDAQLLRRLMENFEKCDPDNSAKCRFTFAKRKAHKAAKSTQEFASPPKTFSSSIRFGSEGTDSEVTDFASSDRTEYTGPVQADVSLSSLSSDQSETPSGTEVDVNSRHDQRQADETFSQSQRGQQTEDSSHESGGIQEAKELSFRGMQEPVQDETSHHFQPATENVVDVNDASVAACVEPYRPEAGRNISEQERREQQHSVNLKDISCSSENGRQTDKTGDVTVKTQYAAVDPEGRRAPIQLQKIPLDHEQGTRPEQQQGPVSASDEAVSVQRDRDHLGEREFVTGHSPSNDVGENTDSKNHLLSGDHEQLTRPEEQQGPVSASDEAVSVQRDNLAGREFAARHSSSNDMGGNTDRKQSIVGLLMSTSPHDSMELTKSLEGTCKLNGIGEDITASKNECEDFVKSVFQCEAQKHENDRDAKKSEKQTALKSKQKCNRKILKARRTRKKLLHTLGKMYEENRFCSADGYSDFPDLISFSASGENSCDTDTCQIQAVIKEEASGHPLMRVVQQNSNDGTKSFHSCSKQHVELEKSASPASEFTTFVQLSQNAVATSGTEECPQHIPLNTDKSLLLGDLTQQQRKEDESSGDKTLLKNNSQQETLSQGDKPYPAEKQASRIDRNTVGSLESTLEKPALTPATVNVACDRQRSVQTHALPSEAEQRTKSEGRVSRSATGDLSQGKKLEDKATRNAKETSQSASHEETQPRREIVDGEKERTDAVACAKQSEQRKTGRGEASLGTKNRGIGKQQGTSEGEKMKEGEAANPRYAAERKTQEEAQNNGTKEVTGEQKLKSVATGEQNPDEELPEEELFGTKVLTEDGEPEVTGSVDHSKEDEAQKQINSFPSDGKNGVNEAVSIPLGTISAMSDVYLGSHSGGKGAECEITNDEEATDAEQTANGTTPEGVEPTASKDEGGAQGSLAELGKETESRGKESVNTMEKVSYDLIEGAHDSPKEMSELKAETLDTDKVLEGSSVRKEVTENEENRECVTSEQEGKPSGIECDSESSADDSEAAMSVGAVDVSRSSTDKAVKDSQRTESSECSENEADVKSEPSGQPCDSKDESKDNAEGRNVAVSDEGAEASSIDKGVRDGLRTETPECSENESDVKSEPSGEPCYTKDDSNENAEIREVAVPGEDVEASSIDKAGKDSLRTESSECSENEADVKSEPSGQPCDSKDESKDNAEGRNVAVSDEGAEASSIDKGVRDGLRTETPECSENESDVKSEPSGQPCDTKDELKDNAEGRDVAVTGEDAEASSIDKGVRDGLRTETPECSENEADVKSEPSGEPCYTKDDSNENAEIREVAVPGEDVEASSIDKAGKDSLRTESSECSEIEADVKSEPSGQPCDSKDESKDNAEGRDVAVTDEGAEASSIDKGVRDGLRTDTPECSENEADVKSEPSGEPCDTKDDSNENAEIREVAVPGEDVEASSIDKGVNGRLRTESLECSENQADVKSDQPEGACGSEVDRKVSSGDVEVAMLGGADVQSKSADKGFEETQKTERAEGLENDSHIKWQETEQCGPKEESKESSGDSEARHGTCVEGIDTGKDLQEQAVERTELRVMETDTEQLKLGNGEFACVHEIQSPGKDYHYVTQSSKSEELGKDVSVSPEAQMKDQELTESLPTEASGGGKKLEHEDVERPVHIPSTKLRAEEISSPASRDGEASTENTASGDEGASPAEREVCSFTMRFIRALLRILLFILMSFCLIILFPGTLDETSRYLRKKIASCSALLLSHTQNFPQE